VKFKVRRVLFLHAYVQDGAAVVAASGFNAGSDNPGEFIDAVFSIFAGRQWTALLRSESFPDLVGGNLVGAVNFDDAYMRSYIRGARRTGSERQKTAELYQPK
jgi:hypothetical protein